VSFRGPEMHFRDILKVISLIEQSVGSMSFQDYSEETKTRAAVERELQIITEAAYRLKPEDEHLCPGPDWRKIRGMGNILRHAYNRLDDEAVWITINDDLPALKQNVSAALATHFPASNS
jgi:uncharacterized protein with HEPN domain